ncbi:GATOR1 complex protein DEPDC5-like isoform X4 [Gordionus sp. m RMFG-2023]|uniref:GATOR1 complex protein DEPDC5-like isoform X4 n=1 Tax=Gordionus sp. m RMFG-2023 TaxID=3053472 RepID=UPI0031FDA7E8
MKILKWRLVRMQIGDIWKNGECIKTENISKYTKFLFRSSTAMVNIFVQMSREMWEFDFVGNLYFERAIYDLIIKIFKLWKSKDCNHDITIIFFSRTYYHAHSLNEFPANDRPFINQDINGKFYQDFYWVIIKNEKCEDYSPIIQKMLVAFQLYSNLTLRLFPSSINNVSSWNSDAMTGNFLEMINLSLNVCEKQHLDCNFERTGQLSIIITPGHGVYEVDRDLSIITKERVTEIGYLPYIVCLDEPPLCIVPLFKFKNKDGDNANYGADYIIPFWLDISFYLEQLDADSLSIFMPRSFNIYDPNYEVKTKEPNIKSTHSRSLLDIDKNNLTENDLNGMSYEEYDQKIFKPCSHNKTDKKDNHLLYLLSIIETNGSHKLNDDDSLYSYTNETFYEKQLYHTHTAAMNYSNKDSSLHDDADVNRSDSPSLAQILISLNKRKKWHSECRDETLGQTETEHSGYDKHYFERYQKFGKKKRVDCITRRKISQKSCVDEYNIHSNLNNKSFKIRQLINPFRLNNIPLKLVSSVYHKWNNAFHSNPIHPPVINNKIREDYATLPIRKNTIENDKDIVDKVTDLNITNTGNIFDQNKKSTCKHVSSLLTSINNMSRVVIFGNQTKTSNLKSGQEMNDKRTTINLSIKDSSDILLNNQPVKPLSTPFLSLQDTLEPISISGSSSDGDSKIDHNFCIQSHIAKATNNKHLKPKFWKPHLKIGVDWKLILSPASLPLTVDFVPDPQSMHRDYIVTNYFVLADEGLQQPDSINMDQNNDKNFYTDNRASFDLLEQLLFQRLRFGGQIVTNMSQDAQHFFFPLSASRNFSSNLIDKLVSLRSTTSPRKPNEYLISIGRAYHLLSLPSSPSNTINITIYKPRHSLTGSSFETTHSLPYTYNLKSAEDESFQRCATHFRFERVLDSFSWNSLDIRVAGAVGLPPSVAALDRFGSALNSARFLILSPPSHLIDFDYKNRESMNDMSVVIKSRTSNECPRFLKLVALLNGVRHSFYTKIYLEDNMYCDIDEMEGENIDKRADKILSEYYLENDEIKNVDHPNRITTASPLEHIIEKLTDNKELIRVTKFHAQTNSQIYCFMSYEIVYWIFRNVEGVKDLPGAFSLCEKLMESSLLKSYSPNNDRLVFGTHLYYIHIDDNIINPISSSLHIIKSPNQYFFEIEFPISYFVNRLKGLIDESYDLIKNEDYGDQLYRKHIIFSEYFSVDIHTAQSEGSISQQPGASSNIAHKHVHNYIKNSKIIDNDLSSMNFPTTTKSYCDITTLEKVDLHYFSCFAPDSAYEIGLEWLSATPNRLIEDLIRKNWARKATTLGFHLIPVLRDPFFYARSQCDQDPLRLPVFLPINETFVRFKYPEIFANSSEQDSHPFPLLQKDFIQFLDQIIRSVFGYIKHVPTPDNKKKIYNQKYELTDHNHQSAKNRDLVNYGHLYKASEFEYIHFSGGMFISLEIQKSSPASTDSRVQQLDYNLHSRNKIIKDNNSNFIFENNFNPINSESFYIPGFRWSWNFLLTKRWRLSSFSEESLLENAFNDFKNFLRDEKLLLNKFNIYHKFRKK